jgi:septum formation protein
MNKKLILASKSPRRQELIKGLELDYEIRTYEVEESFPDSLRAGQIPLFLAEKKANACPFFLESHEILLTADTVVWVNGEVLNKPADRDDAIRMLNMICGTTHEVFTGVCIRGAHGTITFCERTEVTLK